jgi:hypothetical protein
MNDHYEKYKNEFRGVVRYRNLFEKVVVLRIKRLLRITDCELKKAYLQTSNSQYATRTEYPWSE